ncbi:DNA-binding NarL/FixJ family response regulator [Propionicimonas paludicola]|uniref:DNA-binding NarL/FixJ family response regulator n=1 Tax=Propionicimonas paludicola TaxID=185243 RepID=A0A2A9CSN9_9ACTN|nr:LuxR C-terminal-related transcriptional regulator [Propionicimonas paludicola]PFG17434.1 DNA-binding NarL/FixJ family response regulator [Propionicimonas paludicola]
MRAFEAERAEGSQTRLPLVHRLATPAVAEWCELWQGLGAPDWFSRIALAESLTEGLFRMAAESTGSRVSSAELAELYRHLEEAGFLADGPEPKLVAAVRDSMLVELEGRYDGLSRPRREMLRAGLRLGLPDTIPQLALWAADEADWGALERILLTEPGLVRWDLRLQRAVHTLASSERQAHPILSASVALLAALDVERNQLSIAELVGELIKEGAALHSGWADHQDVNAALVAGSFWMLTQACATSALADPGRTAAAATRRAIEERILQANREHHPPFAYAVAIFHLCSAALATAVGRWTEVARQSELVLLLSPRCSLLGVIGASLLAASGFFNGNAGQRTRGELYIADHTGHRCQAAASLAELLHLSKAFAGIHQLDKAEVMVELAALERRQAQHWFDQSLLMACTRAYAGILWQEPEAALAAFDAALGGARPDEVDPVQLRTRAELLINLGEVDLAATMLAAITDAGARFLTLAPAARLHLCAGDLEQARVLAEEGLHAAQLSLADRAALQALKAAVGILNEDDDAEIEQSILAACLISREARSLLPVALLPKGLLTTVLERHVDHPFSGECYLRERLVPAKLADLRPGYRAAGPLMRLTPREKVLLPLLATSASLREIAAQLYVSVNTVRKQVVTLREKFNARTREELVSRAIEKGLLSASGVDPR